MIADFLIRFSDFFSAGGPVMGPLFFISVIMWFLIIMRVSALSGLYKKNITKKKAVQFISIGNSPDPKRFPGQTSRLVRKFLKKKTGDLELDKNILDEIVVEMVRSYDKYITAIGALAGAAPMLGLLGTVLGMISAFDTMAVFGTGNARAMAGGISEALITTQTGLLIAIPGLYMKIFLEQRAMELKKRTAEIGMYIKRNI